MIGFVGVMKILYVTTIGSTMGFFTNFIQELIVDGHTVDIAANVLIKDVPDYYKERGSRVFTLLCSRSPLSSGNIKAYWQLKKIIEAGGYDIIHCHTPVAAMLTRFAARCARKKGTKVFYTAHGFHFYKGAPIKNWLLYYPVERFLARWTDVLITINKEDHQRAQGFKAGKLMYVPGVGIDIAKFSDPISEDERKRVRAEMGVPEDAVLLCSVGELNENKNHSLVIRALAGLENKKVHYCIAGDGGLYGELARLSQELDVAERVHLLGRRNDVPELYKASDAFCFPSFREGLPVSLMEAMASGIPCIASRIRGSVDLLGENSEMLFDPRSADDCKAKLEAFLANRDAYSRIDYEKSILPCSKESVIARMKEIYGIVVQ